MRCSNCGNEQFFTELNYVKTKIQYNPVAEEVVNSTTEILSNESVECDDCGFVINDFEV